MEPAGLLDGTRIGGLGGEIAEQRELAFADDALRIVRVGAEDAPGAAVVIGHGTVGESVVGLLRVAVALHDQEQGFVVGAAVAVHGGTRPGAYLIPDFAPYHAGRLSQGVRMLAPEDGAVGIVIEVHELLAPPDEHGLAGGQHDADGGAQGLGPRGHGAERSGLPVAGPHHGPEFAAAREEVEIASSGLNPMLQRAHSFVS